MFTKNAVSQDVIDAVNSILVQEEKKQMLLEPGKKMELETGFHMAAHAAKKANQSHFEFQGKKYPVTAKSTSEAIEESESNLDHVRNKFRSTYGFDPKRAGERHNQNMDRASERHNQDIDHFIKHNQKRREIETDYHARKREIDLKHHENDPLQDMGRAIVDRYKNYKRVNEKVTIVHGEPPEGVQHTNGMVHRNHNGINSSILYTRKPAPSVPVKQSVLNKVRSQRAESIDEEKDDDSMYTTKAQAKKIADKEAAKEVHKHEKHLHKGSKETKFDEERHMTDDEMAKREKIVKSMKKGMAGFKERYGNRAKNVMYATATKQAMHHEEVDLNEEMHFRKTHKMSHVHSPDTISVTHAHHKDHGHIGHIEEYHECDAGGKHTGNKKYAMEHYPSGKQMHGCDTSEEASKHLKKFHEDYCGKMESMGLKMEEKETSTKKVTPKKESIGGIVGAGDGLGNVKEDMKVDTLAGPTNIKNIPKKQAKELSISNGHSSVKKGELINSGDAAPEPRNKPPYKVKAFEAKTPDGQIGDFTPSVDQPLKERVKDMAKRKFRKENMSGLTLSDQ